MTGRFAGKVAVVTGGASGIGRPEQLSRDEWQWIFGINFFGVVRGIHAFIPRMIERGSGQVVNTARTRSADRRSSARGRPSRRRWRGWCWMRSRQSGF